MNKIFVKVLKHIPQRIKCALNDHFVFRAPVSVAFFYREHLPAELILNSLQIVLNDFPVFAGILIQEEGQLYIDCNNQGVQVSIVQSELSLSAYASDLPNIPPEVFVDDIDPNKILKNRSPLLTIKLNYFSDGMTVGYSWHHSVGDMATFMEFLKALSANAKGKNYATPLILENRESLLNEWVTKEISKSDRESRLKCLSFMDIFHFIRQMYSSKRGVYFYFTEDEIAALRSDLSSETNLKLSRNDALCGHLLSIISRCRSDGDGIHHASIILNYRSRLSLPSNVLGNYIDAVPIKSPKPFAASSIAASINACVKNYLKEHFDPNGAREFVDRNGGIKNVKYMIPKEMLPQYKNLLITNWSKFDVFSIDFGKISPFLFLPVGRSPLAWVSCVVEGFDNKGLLVALVLPSKVAKKLSEPSVLKEIHRYRHHSTPEDSTIPYPWCL